MMANDRTNPAPPPLTRFEKVLRQEVLPCDDPVCCCEAEPRWLLFQHDIDSPDTCSEWDSLARSPADEL